VSNIYPLRVYRDAGSRAAAIRNTRPDGAANYWASWARTNIRREPDDEHRKHAQEAYDAGYKETRIL
jgi:hypothetical protein